MDEMPPVPGVQHHFVDVGGVRIHVAEAGSGEPVVMLHGWPQHWYLWREVIPRLAPHARVICPDLRGFGWSDAPGSGYDRETMRRDVEGLLDRLELDRIRLVGHDWGGWVGFRLCAEQPERVARFVAAGILPPWPSRDPRSVLELWRAAYQVPLSLPHVGRRLVEHGARLLLRRGSKAFSTAEVDAFARRLTGERARASELLYRSFLTREGPAAAAGRYDRPLEVATLLLVGGRDLAVPARTLREHAARTALLEVEVLPDAGHFVVDERPALVAERVLRMF